MTNVLRVVAPCHAGCHPCWHSGCHLGCLKDGGFLPRAVSRMAASSDECFKDGGDGVSLSPKLSRGLSSTVSRMAAPFRGLSRGWRLPVTNGLKIVAPCH